MKRIFYILILSAFIFSCEKPISEFQSRNFIKFFGSGFESKGNDVIELSDETYFFTGYDNVKGTDYQIFAAKVDKNGNQVWSKTFGIYGIREEGKIVKELSDGLLIAGTSLGSSGITHSFIMKTDVYGDSLWYKEFGDASISIVVNDITLNESSIFVAGQAVYAGNTKTDYYGAKLDLSGDKVWNVVTFFRNTNSTFKKIFLEGENILFIGTDGNENIYKRSIVTCKQSDGLSLDFENSETVNEIVADASLVEDQLFILTNVQDSMQLSKLNSSHIEEWKTEMISPVTGKTFVYNEDGTLLIFAETAEDGTTLINTIKVDAGGSTEYGAQSFRTFPGTIGKAIQTNDKGVIFVGTTNPTFGANVQLVKTDKDLFLLKP